MLVSKDNNRRVVYYFYTNGHYWTASYFGRVLRAFLDRAILSQISTWTLIQVSTPLTSANDEARLSAACVELFSPSAALRPSGDRQAWPR